MHVTPLASAGVDRGGVRTPGDPQPHTVLVLVTCVLEKAFSEANKHFHQATHVCTTHRFVPGDLLEDNVVGCRLTGCHVIGPRQLPPPQDERPVLEAWGKVQQSLL